MQASLLCSSTPASVHCLFLTNPHLRLHSLHQVLYHLHFYIRWVVSHDTRVITFTRREISKPGGQVCFYLADFNALVIVLIVVYAGMNHSELTLWHTEYHFPFSSSLYSFIIVCSIGDIVYSHCYVWKSSVQCVGTERCAEEQMVG